MRSAERSALTLCSALPSRVLYLRACSVFDRACRLSVCACCIAFKGFKGCRKTEPVANSTKETYPNVPASLPMVLEAVAKAYGESVTVDQVALATTQNAQRFFGF